MNNPATEIHTERIPAPDSLDAQLDLLHSKGWTDGLPVVPPTAERVVAMMAGTHRSSDALIGLVPPRWGTATVDVIAANAVMAGCLPEHMPVIITALEALLDKRFNLYGTQATTHAVAPLLILNGPVVEALNFNFGYNLFGPGWRANASVGRAINLILRNVGGALPGALDRSTAGQPGKYTFCIAENEAENPWQPLHVERGFRVEQSTVTVDAGGGILDLNDRSSRTAPDLMQILAQSLKIHAGNGHLMGGEPLLVVCPEHAFILHRDGISKPQLKHYLWQHARIPSSEFPDSYYRDEVEPLDDPNWIPLCYTPDQFIIIVGGGAGRHSMYIPTFAASYSVTREITDD
ncbi:MAG: hypothetical protein V3S24_01610 [Candidatus Tectomicrobia bacterium]